MHNHIHIVDYCIVHLLTLEFILTNFALNPHEYDL